MLPASLDTKASESDRKVIMKAFKRQTMLTTQLSKWWIWKCLCTSDRVLVNGWILVHLCIIGEKAESCPFKGTSASGRSSHSTSVSMCLLATFSGQHPISLVTCDDLTVFPVASAPLPLFCEVIFICGINEFFQVHLNYSFIQTFFFFLHSNGT